MLAFVITRCHGSWLAVGVLAALVITVAPAQAQPDLFQDGFESGSPCRWSNVNPPVNCPPKFGGIAFVYSSGIDALNLTWLEALDDDTAASELIYRVHLSTIPNFTPTPENLVASFFGETQGVLTALLADTTYHLLLLAEDQDGATSLERDYRSARTPAFLVVEGDTPLEQARRLGLGEPITVTESSLIFERTAKAIPPTVGTILVGQHADGGYLRGVEGVTLTATTIIVETRSASLAEAFDQVDIISSLTLFDATGTDEEAETLPDGRIRHVLSWSEPLLLVEQVNAEGSGTWDRQVIRGSGGEVIVSVKFEPQLKLDVSWSLFGGIESGEAIAMGTLSINATARYNFSEKGTFDPDPYKLFRRSWSAYYQVGLVPVFQKVTLEVEIQASAMASTKIQAEASAISSATVEFGLRYNPSSDQWVTVSSTDFNNGVTANLSVEGSLEGEVRVIPRITVEVYESIGAKLSAEPFVAASISAENTGAPLCAPFQLTAFDVGLGFECFAGVDFTAFNANYSLVDSRRVCGPLNFPLFSLPEIQLSTEGSGVGGDPLVLTAAITDGTSNRFALSSSMWQADPDTGTLTVTTNDPPTAEFLCGEDELYTLTFSGYGALHEVARRCFEVEQSCDGGCMTGIWVDNFGFGWDLVQSGDSITGTVEVPCGESRVVTGSLTGTDVTLNALGGPMHCCDFIYTGTINECSSGSGTWIQVPGGPNCDGSGTWSMQRGRSAPPGGGEVPTIVPDRPTTEF